ncbi:hypothetical protein pb186bvf_018411 [Paramecium bursaria]
MSYKEQVNKRGIFTDEKSSLQFNKSFLLPPQTQVVLSTSQVISNTNPNDELQKIENQKMLLSDIHSIPPQNLENIMILLKQTPNQNSKSRILQSTIQYNSQFYQQLEIDAEGIRERLKQDSQSIKYILDRYNETKQEQLQLKNQIEQNVQNLKDEDSCTQSAKFKTEIKYQFNQLEQRVNEFKDLYTKSYDLMTIFSTIAHDKLASNFLAENVTENQFTSMTVEFRSYLENQAKVIEVTISEQRRLVSISQDGQFKQVCQTLMDMIQKYPNFEEEKKQKFINVQKSASQYFKQFSQELSQQLQQYQQLVDDYRNSITQIDKIKYLFEQAQSQEAINTQYFNLQESLKIMNTKKIVLLQKTPQQQINTSLIKSMNTSFPYFKKMYNKVFQKTQIRLKILQKQNSLELQLQQNISKSINTLFEFKQQEYQQSVAFIIQQLNQLLTKENWIKLQQLNDERLESTNKLRNIQNQIGNFKSTNPLFESLIKELKDEINHQLNIQNSLNKPINDYLQIEDIDAQIEFQQIQIEYNNQHNILTPYLQQFLSGFNQILFDFDNNQQNRIDFEQKMRMMKIIYAQFEKIQYKRMIGNVNLVKQNLLDYINLRSGILILLESQSYLNPLNLTTISEDFEEFENKFRSVDQLKEVVTQSIKEIQTIECHHLEQIKLQQLEGFRWVYRILILISQYYNNLNILIKTYTKEKPLDQSDTLQSGRSVSIPYQEFEDFTQNNKFGLIFKEVNQCPNNPEWLKIQQQFCHVLLSTFILYQSKVLLLINVLGGDVILSQGAIDSVRANLIVQFLRQDQHNKDLEKAIVLYQINGKIKQIFQNVQDQQYKSNLIMIQDKLSDFINTISSQQKIMPEIIQIFYQLKRKESSDLYISLQEQWMDMTDQEEYIESLRHKTGVFENIQYSEFMNQILQ